MKIALIGKHLDDVRPLLTERGWTVAEPPELVVAHGGDGTLLQAEREFPLVPKLPIRDGGTAPTCPRHSAEAMLDNFLAGKFSLQNLPVIAGRSGGKILKGINDIFIHSLNRVGALRYRVWIDGELYAYEIVGDGAGLSTVHGASAYYRSITHSLFRVGLGLAFNNSTEPINHLVLAESSHVKIQIVRGPALMVADNSPEEVIIEEGAFAELYRTEESAQVYGLDCFMCQECRRLRHPHRYPPAREVVEPR
ncbi:MAG: hypothetical protein PHS41_01170 [Victivallaceae bacterium]|nr:hypothetical protein [Victivallaceae bacterium]